MVDHDPRPENESLDAKQSALHTELEKVTASKEALRTLADDMIPGPDGRTWQGRKEAAMKAAEQYDPSAASEKDNRLMFNLLLKFDQGGFDGRPLTADETALRAKVGQIRTAGFGESGPQLQTDKVALNHQNEVREWHGQPIYLRITGGTEAQHADLTLSQGGDHKWYIEGYNSEAMELPVGGLTIGRSTNVDHYPQLKTTLAELARNDQVSREHLTIRLTPQGELQLLEHSTNGTYLQESYYKAEEAPKTDQTETKRQGLLARARQALQSDTSSTDESKQPEQYSPDGAYYGKTKITRVEGAQAQPEPKRGFRFRR